MRQMWASEQQWSQENGGQQQRVNEERDEGGGGFDDWARGEEEAWLAGFRKPAKRKPCYITAVGSVVE